MKERDLAISEERGAKANISDLVVYGNTDTFRLLCKASSQEQGFMKSTKVCNVDEGCIVQVTTQQKNPDGSYAVAEALTYVPGMNIDCSTVPRKLVSCEDIAKREYDKAVKEYKHEFNIPENHGINICEFKKWLENKN